MESSSAPAAAADTSARLAACAQAFEARLQGMLHELDPSWRPVLAPELAMLEQLPGEAARRRFTALWLAQRCGGWPPLQRCLEPAPRLALLRREAMLRQLCTLALARRPGVLRCVVERRARKALQEALGPNHDPLRSLSSTGRAAADGVTEWTPLHWACIGYGDWIAALQADDRPMRRIVRLSLPQGLLNAPRLRRRAPAECSLPQALQRLREQEVAWPC